MTDVNHLLPIGDMGDTDGGQNVRSASPQILKTWDEQTRFICPASCLLGELAAVELGVKAACREQFIVRAALDNLAIAHY